MSLFQFLKRQNTLCCRHYIMASGTLETRLQSIFNDNAAVLHDFQVGHLILSQLSVPHLWNCSQVCRSWRKTVATMHFTKKFTAFVKGSCSDIRELDYQSQHTTWSLVNSLQIHVPREHSSCYVCLTKSDAMTFCANLTRLPLRYLDFRVNSCKATQQLMQQILLDARFTLEELTLTYDVKVDGQSLLGNDNATYPKLRILNVQPRFNLWPHDMFDLIARAPNLIAVEGAAWLNDIERLSCKRFEVFRKVNLLPFEDVDETFKLLVCANPKLTALRISDTDERIMPQSWFPYLLQLLQQCELTLQHFSVCAADFLKIQSESFALHALNCLELFLPGDSTVEDFRSIVRNLNLYESCPHVRTLRFTLSEDFCIHEMPSTLFAHSSVSVPAHSIREVIVQNPVCTVAVVEECILSFPKLRKFGFEIMACAELCENLEIEHFFQIHKIWTELLTLEELKICLVHPKDSPGPHALDALLCGISMDEASEIHSSSVRGQVDLKNLQFCPIRPSLFNAKNLKTVTLVYSPKYRPRAFHIPNLSKHLVFSRNPALCLNVVSHCRRISDELKGLEDFANVTIVTERCEWW